MHTDAEKILPKILSLEDASKLYNDTFSRITFDVRTKGYMDDDDRFNFHKLVGPTLIESFSKPCSDYDKNVIYEIEIRNLYILALTVGRVLELNKPEESCIPDVERKIFLEELKKYSKNEQYGMRVVMSMKYISSDRNIKAGSKLYGKIPSRGIFDSRQSEANQWWGNYNHDLRYLIKFILQYTNDSRDKAHASALANIVYYLWKSQSHRFYFLKGESENDGVRRNLESFFKYCESFKKENKPLSIDDLFFRLK
jgi:hypothetical protein